MLQVIHAPKSEVLTTPAQRNGASSSEFISREPLSPVDQRLRQLSLMTQALLRQLPQHRMAETAWSQLRELVESLPLTTDEFARYVNRLTNAERYAAQGELGAAKFELQMFARQLSPAARLSGR